MHGALETEVTSMTRGLVTLFSEIYNIFASNASSAAAKVENLSCPPPARSR